MSADRIAKAEPIEMWVCNICGAHPDNDSRWCAVGCGRDYNQMNRIEIHGVAAPSGQWLLREDIENLIADRKSGWRDCPKCGKHNGSISANINFGTGPKCYVVDPCDECKRKENARRDPRTRRLPTHRNETP